LLKWNNLIFNIKNMFKKDEEFTEGGETVIARGVKLEGDFNSQGNVVVEGEVSGSVTTSSDLRVSESAKISADVKAQNAVVAGEISGNTKIQDKLELMETASINGDIETGVLSVAPGACVNGRIVMGGDTVVEASKGNKKENKKSEKNIEQEEDEI